MIDARNEMIIQEKEREVKENNFIIHGIDEKGENFEDMKKAKFLKKLMWRCNLKITFVWVNPKITDSSNGKQI